MKAKLLTCIYCAKQYKLNKPDQKYCSRVCYLADCFPYIKKTCPHCLEEFEVTKTYEKKIFCSNNCRLLAFPTAKEKRRLLNNRRKMRNGIPLKSARAIAFKQKEKTCELCGFEEYEFCLDVHHIDENPSNNDINNLAVLCVICHRKIHKGVVSL